MGRKRRERMIFIPRMTPKWKQSAAAVVLMSRLILEWRVHPKKIPSPTRRMQPRLPRNNKSRSKKSYPTIIPWETPPPFPPPSHPLRPHPLILITMSAITNHATPPL